MLIFLNYYSVFIYGLLIMFFLLDIKKNIKNIIPIVIYLMVYGGLIFAILNLYGLDFIVKAYPFVIHIPLVLFFCIYFKKNFTSVLFVLCIAYVMTTPRKWFGELLNVIVEGNSNSSMLFQIFFSIPLLFFAYKYLRPAIVKIIQYSGIKLLLLTLIPFLYYLIAYATTVYSNVLYKSNVLVVGFLATVITYVFYAFIVTYFNEITKKFDIINEQNVLKLQTTALELQIEQTRELQNRAAIYNHDIRHHLNLIEGYIGKGNITEAREYIAKINNNLNNITVKRYCENEILNSILSYYIHKAEEHKISITNIIKVPGEIKLESTDLCVIIANGLENAINAVEKIPDYYKRQIEISIFLKNNKLCIEIVNNYLGVIQFENEIPLSDRENHGIGTKSIVAACNKYNGIYSFEADGNVFSLKIILNL